jgi:chromosomal replication initiator protein
MEPEKLWKTVLAELELSVSKATFQTHFAKSGLISFQDNVATIGLSNPLVRTMVETRYYSLVKSILDHNTNSNTSLVFVVTASKKILTEKEAGPLFSQMIESPRMDVIGAARRLHIHPEFTFETFAVSTTNQIAYAAASAVAKSPGSAYNLLFF